MAEVEGFAVKESGQISMKVVGIGGAGSNIVDRLMLSNPAGIQLTVINPDYHSEANSSDTDERCIGESITRGLGASGDPGIGKEAALADKAFIAHAAAHNAEWRAWFAGEVAKLGNAGLRAIPSKAAR